MKLFWMQRGQKEYSDKFIRELSSHYVPFVHNIDGKGLRRENLNLRVCPIEFYQVSFPAEYRDIVLTTIFGKSDGTGMCPDTKESWVGFFVRWIRRFLKLKPIPKDFNKDKWLSMSFPEHLEIIPLGLKEDTWLGANGEKKTKEEAGDGAFEQL